MIKLTVDGIEVEVEEGSTVLHACETAGREIPRFCYHERLSVAGNCRMCLVEMEKAPKPVASCAMPAAEGMDIKTDSPMVKKAREGVMEFMLVNHPLDCPICDQAGECDLQDQAMGYGGDRSRYREPKRAVEDKHMGPLISTIMTRCIHCTRCVRFSTEVAGVAEMGALGRGENMEITTYLEKALASELSGNVVDLCPVGALTSRPYAFNARPWELDSTETIDVMDAVGSAIRVDTRGNEVMRVLPRVNDDVNEEWISDKTRHAHDGLLRQRLDRPYMRKNRRGQLQETSWEEAFRIIARKVGRARPGHIGAIAGDQCDAESMYALLKLMRGLGSPNTDCRQDGSVIGTGDRPGYVFNSGFSGLEETDFVLLVGSNPRHEAAVVNARLRRRWLDDGLQIARIGPATDLTYPVVELGDNLAELGKIARGAHPVAKKMKRAKKPVIILGQGALNRGDSRAVYELALHIAHTTGAFGPNWNGFNVLHTAAARVAGLDMGFVPERGGMGAKVMVKGARDGKLAVLFLLGADECDFGEISSRTFVVYQGSHGDAGARIADVVLPGAAWCEKDATFTNSEGRVQRAQRATFPPGDAREDWAILRALSEHLDVPLGFDSLEALREALVAEHPVFDGSFPAPGELEASASSVRALSSRLAKTPVQYSIDGTRHRSFYMTCPISRNSATMAECVEVFEMQGREAAE